MTPELEREDHAIVDLLRDAIDDLIAVYRFGSTAEGVSHPASDTDVAVPARARINADDVLVNKAAAIERAVRRVREEHAGDDSNLLTNQTRQDAVLSPLTTGLGPHGSCGTLWPDLNHAVLSRPPSRTLRNPRPDR